VRHAYVYYRIDLTQAGLASIRVDALLLTMAVHCGQHPHRMQRCDDPATWMEIYPDIADLVAFSTALDAATQALDCAAFVLGERHLECFSAPPV
jgi:cytochrome c1